MLPYLEDEPELAFDRDATVDQHGFSPSAETARKLLHDAVADRIRHPEDVVVDVLVVADVRREVAAQPVRGLGERLVEVLLHHRVDGGEGQEAGIGAAQKPCDLAAVAIPGRLGRGKSRAVAGLRRLEQLDRAGDVLLQQRGRSRA